MKTLTADVAVIGAGSAGISAYRAATAHGKRVVLIESGAYGTTCARVGCMPSKLLIAAADAAHAANGAEKFGVHVTGVRVDGQAVMQRVKAERDRFVGFVVEGVEKIEPSLRLHGHARFVAPDTLQIDEHTQVTAASIVIATGSSPQVPDEFRQIGRHLVVNDDVFDWDDLPASVAVIGTGVIGLELGQALHRLGVRVTIFGRSGKIAQLQDDELNAVAVACLGAELDLRLDTTIVSASLSGAQVELRSQGKDGGQRTEYFQYVLVATGRVPNLSGLALEQSGLTLDDKGIPLFDAGTMRCGDSAIFLAGDVDNDRPLLHEATDEGRIAGNNAGQHPDVTAGLRRIALAIAFTDPQIASVGQTSRTLQSNQYETGEVSFEDQGRSRVMLQNRGLLRVYGERGTHRFLGADMVGPRAEHIAHLLAWACQARLTIEQMLDMPFYHPVVEEGVRSALRNLKENLLKKVSEIEHCADYTPGC